MKKNKKKIFFYWVCDDSLNTGEGILGKKFINHFKKKNNCIVKKIKTKKNFLFNYKYISPIIGIIYLWYFFLKKKEIIYVNYLPLWNTLIFLLVPPNTILGPITGGAHFDNSNYANFFVRKYLFYIFYKLSEYIIIFRFNNIIFSTDLLKKNLKEKTIKKSTFNFVLENIEINKKKNSKEKVLLIYNRNHKNKKYLLLEKVIEKFLKLGFKVEIIGDKINLKYVKNYGYISHKKVLKLLKRVSYSIISNENIYSLFTIDCINNGVKLLIENKKYNSIKFYKEYFIKYNSFLKLDNLIKK